MRTYKPDIVGSYEESHLLLFPQEKLVSREGGLSAHQWMPFKVYLSKILSCKLVNQSRCECTAHDSFKNKLLLDFLNQFLKYERTYCICTGSTGKCFLRQVN